VDGLPRGRILEAFGPEQSGKSTVFYQAVAQAQAAGGFGVILDYENTWTDAYGEALGINTDPAALLVESPASLEEGFALARRITKAADPERPLIVVFDSLAAMALASELDPKKVTTDAILPSNTIHMLRAKAISDVLRVATNEIANAGAVWAFVNHEKDVIQLGGPPRPAYLAPQKRTPGGRSVKFYASIRLQFLPGARIKGDVLDVVTGEVKEGIVARKVRVSTPKNKVAPPDRSVDVFVRYGHGIDDAYSLFEAGVARKLIGKSGSHYTLPTRGEPPLRIHGAAGAIETIRNDPALVESLTTAIKEAIRVAWSPDPTPEEAATDAPHDD
jgi:recombination protein RecA